MRIVLPYTVRCAVWLGLFLLLGACTAAPAALPTTTVLPSATAVSPTATRPAPSATALPPTVTPLPTASPTVAASATPSPTASPTILPSVPPAPSPAAKPAAGNARAAPPQGSSCPPSHPIKGNQGSRSTSEWIYHLPGGASYRVTVPEECFANETDARAAGYRRSLR